MQNLTPDQAAAVPALRRILDAIRWLETWGDMPKLWLADTLRRRAEAVGRPLPTEFVNRVLFEYSGPAPGFHW